MIECEYIIIIITSKLFLLLFIMTPLTTLP